MEKQLRIGTLKAGGKRGLSEYNRMCRIPPVAMDTGTRIHKDKRFREKCRERYEEETE